MNFGMGVTKECNPVNTDKIWEIEEAKNGLLVLSECCANQTRIVCSGPVTPDSRRESGKEKHEHKHEHEHEHDMSSPLTVTSSSPLSAHISKTPNEALFDSFAADKSMLDYSHHHSHNAMRRLNFSCPIDAASYGLNNFGGEMIISDEQEYMFEIVYGFIVDAIVSEQQNQQLVESNSPSTPKSAPHLSWISETCPGAPTKPTRKSRINIDILLDPLVCRKLEF